MLVPGALPTHRTPKAPGTSIGYRGSTFATVRHYAVGQGVSIRVTCTQCACGSHIFVGGQRTIISRRRIVHRIDGYGHRGRI